MQTQLSLTYSGPAVESGQMDVYQASANMIAFSEFVVAAAKTVYGEQTNARAEVAGFARGSFVTDLIFHLAGPAATIFSSVSVESLTHVIKQAFALWKHLRGQPPAHIEHTDQNVSVTNSQGEVLLVQIQTLNLTFNEKAADAVGQFVRTAVSKEGVDSVHIGIEGGTLAEARQDEAAYFLPVRPSETVTDAVIKMSLIIEAAVFKEGNKWRFWDGANSIYADIQDQLFLARVDAGERFGKGDILVAEVRFIQERSGFKIATERIVEKVLEHRFANEQMGLFGSKPDGS